MEATDLEDGREIAAETRPVLDVLHKRAAAGGCRGQEVAIAVHPCEVHEVSTLFELVPRELEEAPAVPRGVGGIYVGDAVLVDVAHVVLEVAFDGEDGLHHRTRIGRSLFILLRHLHAVLARGCADLRLHGAAEVGGIVLLNVEVQPAVEVAVLAVARIVGVVGTVVGGLVVPCAGVVDCVVAAACRAETAVVPVANLIAVCVDLRVEVVGRLEVPVLSEVAHACGIVG